MKKILCLLVSLILVLSVGFVNVTAWGDDWQPLPEILPDGLRVRAGLGGVELGLDYTLVVYRDGVEYKRVTAEPNVVDGIVLGSSFGDFWLSANGTREIALRFELPEGWAFTHGIGFQSETSTSMLVNDWEELRYNPGAPLVFDLTRYIDPTAWYCQGDHSINDPCDDCSPYAGRVTLPWGTVQGPRTATPTAATVLVDGEPINFQAYNIAGSTFFRLRDVAYVLNGTASQFSVDWVAETDRIRIVRNQEYVPVGGEMVNTSEGAATAIPTTSLLDIIVIQNPQNSSEAMRNWEGINSNAYNIGGNNYFAIRDIGRWMGFNVDWDNDAQAILITTN